MKLSCVSWNSLINSSTYLENYDKHVHGFGDITNLSGLPFSTIPGGPQKREQSIQSIFSGLCSDQQLYFFTLLDRASFPHYNNTKINKFG